MANFNTSGQHPPLGRDLYRSAKQNLGLTPVLFGNVSGSGSKAINKLESQSPNVLQDQSSKLTEDIKNSQFNPKYKAKAEALKESIDAILTTRAIAASNPMGNNPLAAAESTSQPISTGPSVPSDISLSASTLVGQKDKLLQGIYEKTEDHSERLTTLNTLLAPAVKESFLSLVKSKLNFNENLTKTEPFDSIMDKNKSNDETQFKKDLSRGAEIKFKEAESFTRISEAKKDETYSVLVETVGEENMRKLFLCGGQFGGDITQNLNENKPPLLEAYTINFGYDGSDVEFNIDLNTKMVTARCTLNFQNQGAMVVDGFDSDVPEDYSSNLGLELRMSYNFSELNPNVQFSINHMTLE